MKHLLVLSFLALPFFSIANTEKEKTETTAAVAEAKTSSGLIGSVGDIYNDFAPLAGVKVTVISGNKEIQKSTETDNTGHFTFDELQPGTYELKFQKRGFETFTRKYVVVEEGRKANYGFFLYKS